MALREAKNKSVRCKPNILLISVDTLRADHLSCYGYSKATTKSFDRLAKEGILFTKAYTPVPITLPSHSSIMTGKYPISHRVMDNGIFFLDEEEETLAECLKQEGYFCAAFIGSFVLDSQFGLNQGFDIYADDFDTDEPKGEKKRMGLSYPERRGNSVTNDFIEWLDSYRTSADRSPFFAWVHYFDPHFAYEPPEPLYSQFKDNLYDGEIAYTDLCLKRLFDKLISYDLWDSTWIILVGDHGEGMGEHNETYHGVFLYDSTLHVPLIMRYPELITPSTINSQVRTIDIAPSILDALEIRPLKEVDGVSFAKVFEGKSIDHLTLYCQSEYGLNGYGWSPLEGIRQDEYKYIQAPHPELYNIHKDKKELYNLINKEAARAKSMESTLKELKAKLEKQTVAPTPKSMDSETAQKLFSLGYVFSGKVESQDHAELPDPKERIKLLNDMDMATFYLETGHDEKALKQFEKVIIADPNNLYARYMIGMIQKKRGKYDLAEAAFLEVLKIRSNYLDIHLHLGGLYEIQGRFSLALEQLQLAAEGAKKEEDMYYTMGLIHEKMENFDLAIENFNKSLEILPEQYRVYYSLGSVYRKQGLSSKAILKYRQALELNPDSAEIYNSLGILYHDINKLTEAKEAILKAIELAPEIAIHYKNLGDIYFKEKDYKQAKKYLQKSITLNPSSNLTYSSLGNVYFMEKKYEKALNKFRKAIELDPEFTQAHYNLGYTLYTLGRISEAIEALRETIRLDPYLTPARLLLEKARQQLIE